MYNASATIRYKQYPPISTHVHEDVEKRGWPRGEPNPIVWRLRFEGAEHVVTPHHLISYWFLRSVIVSEHLLWCLLLSSSAASPAIHSYHHLSTLFASAVLLLSPRIWAGCFPRSRLLLEAVGVKLMRLNLVIDLNLRQEILRSNGKNQHSLIDLC